MKYLTIKSKNEDILVGYVSVTEADLKNADVSEIRKYIEWEADLLDQNNCLKKSYVDICMSIYSEKVD